MIYGILRIRSTGELGGDVARDQYLSRLLKLIPGEVAALYTWALAIFAGSPARLYAAFAVCLALLIFIRTMATRRNRGGKVQWIAITVSTISFGIWALVLGNPFQTLLGYQARDAAFAMAAWTIFVPWIYKGDRE